MRFNVGCELRYEVSTPTTLILNLDVQRNEHQLVLAESFVAEPAVANEPFYAPDTNNLYRRILLPEGTVRISSTASVELGPHIQDPSTISEIPVAQLPLGVLPFLYPTRFCQSDELARFALRQFGAIPTGHDRVTQICNWIHSEVDYLSGSSHAATSAADTFKLRAGVCRDFAHLGITFCRALGIPARFVAAYGWQLEPQDFHAVFEAYLAGRWYLFDASRLCPLDGIVRIGTGRDAAETAFSTFYGTMTAAPKKVWIEPSGEADARASWTTMAVSTAER